MHAADVDLILAGATGVPGVDRRALARDAAAGRMVRVRQGAYVAAADWALLNRSDRHVVAMRAVQDRSRRPLVFSHWSAAAAHGFPVRTHRLTLVHCTTSAGSTDNRSGVRAHPLALPEEDVVEVHGLRCTAPARTAVDLAAAADFRDAVMVADAALRSLERAGGSKDDLSAAWRRAGPRRAWRKVDGVIDFANGRSGSAGESSSRVSMAVFRLPAPELQEVFTDAFGFVAEVDFWWPHLRVAGEMDGRVKYFDPVMNGGDPARVVYEEKRREDRLRALVGRVARWSWEEAESPALLGAKLAQAGVHPLTPRRSFV